MKMKAEYEAQLQELKSHMNQNWEDKSSKSKKYEKERQLLLAKNREEQKQLQRQFELEKQKRWALMEEKGDIEGMLSADDFHVGPMVVKKQTFGERGRNILYFSYKNY